MQCLSLWCYQSDKPAEKKSSILSPEENKKCVAIKDTLKTIKLTFNTLKITLV